MNNNFILFKEYYNENIDKELKRIKDSEKENMNEIIRFNNEFSINKIKELSLKDYIFERGKKRTFCSKLMNEYKCGPNIDSGSIQSKFGIYYVNKRYLNYKNEIINNPNEYYKGINNQLVEVLNYILNGNQDIDYRRYNYLHGMWHSILKIAYFINSKNNITFGSFKILKSICKYFEIPVNKKDNSLNLGYRIKKYLDDNIPRSKDIDSFYTSSLLWMYYKNNIELNGKPKHISTEELQEEEDQHLEINSGRIKSYSKKQLEEIEKKALDYHYEPKTINNYKELRITDGKLKATRIEMSKHKCEVDKKHKSFTDSTGKHQYLECHHIIPISAQKDFPNIELDSMFNIIALCPNCHKKVHYAMKKERYEIFIKMYKTREKEMIEKGFDLDKIENIFNKYY